MCYSFQSAPLCACSAAPVARQPTRIMYKGDYALAAALPLQLSHRLGLAQNSFLFIILALRPRRVINLTLRLRPQVCRLMLRLPVLP
jgi:hypothetical protein